MLLFSQSYIFKAIVAFHVGIKVLSETKRPENIKKHHTEEKHDDAISSSYCSEPITIEVVIEEEKLIISIKRR